MNKTNSTVKNLYQPMTQQNQYFYKNDEKQNLPVPGNVNQLFTGMGNFANAFNPLPNIPYNGVTPKSMFQNNNFVNKGDLLHNNLQTILLNEEIKEYSVLIDSKDRNYQVYPDPFHYDVLFNALPSSREIDKRGNVIKYEAPHPIVNCKFENVRYIKLEDAILPLFTKIKCFKDVCDNTNELVESLKVDIGKPLTENLYVVLSLGQKYVDNNLNSTNDVLSDSFAAIYYDYKINDTHYRGFSKNGIRIFEPDQLGEINKFQVTFRDPYGKPLTVNHVNKKILSNMECNCEDPTGDEDTDCFKHNLRHPLNPLFQHHLHIKIGVVEPRLNKMTFS